MRHDRQYIGDMLEAIGRIERYRIRGEKAFKGDELLQIWMVHYLQIIGEAASRLSSGLRTEFPDVAWTQIIGMRNILVHQYQDIDTDVVWSTLETSIPILKNQLEWVQEQLIEGE